MRIRKSVNVEWVSDPKWRYGKFVERNIKTGWVHHCSGHCFLSHRALIRSWVMLMAWSWFVSAPHSLSPSQLWLHFTWREALHRELPLRSTNQQPTIFKRWAITYLIVVIRHSFLAVQFQSPGPYHWFCKFELQTSVVKNTQKSYLSKKKKKSF